MKKEIYLGLNKTGIQMSPILSKELDEAVDQMPIDVNPEIISVEEFRMTCVNQADPIGSVPLPASFKGILNTVADKASGINVGILIDKLSERAAFERTGTRLYDALIAKVLAWQDLPEEVLPTLERFREEEHQHFQLIIRTMEDIGADSTAQTPCADLIGIASMGILKVITDPRTNFSQCLNVLLTAELTDNASWELLIELAKQSGHKKIETDFNIAYKEEQEHLITIQGWLKTTTLGQL